MQRVVYASSETVLGLPFDQPPAFAPIDETHPPRPESSYALSKLTSETLAEQFVRRTGVPHVGLRISNIMEPDDYARFPGFWDDASLRKWNLWGYVDVRDVARACRLGLTADVSGAEVCIIAASDTVMVRDSASLMAEVFPTVPLQFDHGPRDAAVDHTRARGAGVRTGVQLARRSGSPTGRLVRQLAAWSDSWAPTRTRDRRARQAYVDHDQRDHVRQLESVVPTSAVPPSSSG